jgi:hypothetical protein
MIPPSPNHYLVLYNSTTLFINAHWYLWKKTNLYTSGYLVKMPLNSSFSLLLLIPTFSLHKPPSFFLQILFASVLMFILSFTFISLYIIFTLVLLFPSIFNTVYAFSKVSATVNVQTTSTLVWIISFQSYTTKKSLTDCNHVHSSVSGYWYTCFTHVENNIYI